MKIGRYIEMPWPSDIDHPTRMINAKTSFHNAGISLDDCYYKSGGLWWIFCTEQQLTMIMLGGGKLIESKYL